MITKELLAKARRNDVNAMIEVAKEYYNSDADDNHAELAVEWLQRIIAIEPMCGVAWGILANCYCYGYGIEQDAQKGLSCYRLAIEQKDAMACFNLAECYRNGVCAEKDIREAIRYYSLAGEYGMADGWEMIGELYQEGEEIAADYDKANAYFQKGMEEGCSRSFYSMALAYEYGMGVEQDSKEAAALWETAAELEHCGARYITGMNYLNSSGVNTDITRALYWLELSADQGHCDAALELGDIYYRGKYGVKIDFKKAKEYYRLAAELEKVEAIERLGLILHDESDYEECLKWSRKGCEYNSRICMLLLTDILMERARKNRNVQKFDLSLEQWREALYWTEKLNQIDKEDKTSTAEFYEEMALCAYSMANRDNNIELYRTVIDYYKKIDRTPVPVVTYAYIKSLWETQQSSKAERETILLLQNHNASLPDELRNDLELRLYASKSAIPMLMEKYSEAVEWLEKMVDLDSIFAMKNLAWIYATGADGVGVDYKKAFKLRLKAATLGDPESQYNVAVHYIKGVGVEQDDSMGLYWIRKSAAQGYEKACEILR